MFKLVCFLAFVATAYAGTLGLAPAVAALPAPIVTARSSQSIARNYNTLAAGPLAYAAPLAYTAPVAAVAPAPLAYSAPALAPAVAPLAYTAPGFSPYPATPVLFK